ncbi:MAG TPA: ferritin-like domain-containing protein [Pyrinomonadaceae bacterium]|nr:ferritin-like domain-containing protein [Pyrinomonadaceae bacterium]
MFETSTEVLSWYERQPRAVSKEFIDNIPWDEVRKHPLNSAFIPVLIYMRDVEYFTDMYYRELRRTPTGKDPIIVKFMDRWSVEELQHAELLNRFMEEAGVPTSAKWQAEASAKIPWRYTIENYILDIAANPFGKYFHAVHMVWGAINEITTLQGYRRLSELAGHPVLKQLLTGIMQEEAIHSTFYWSIARLKLKQAKFSRDLARFVISKFWSPVGQGAKPVQETNYVMSTLFNGATGLEFFTRNVANRIEQLPGFAGCSALTERVAPIVQA